MKTLNVMSIFFSISGEVNIWPQGTSTIFIRLAGCNLKCPYCDTPDSINAKGVSMTIQEIFDKISGYNCKRVLITGGEPLLQRDGLGWLITFLKQVGYVVSVETNGSLSLYPISTAPDCWVVDIKMPSSGQYVKMLNDIEYSNRKVIFKIPIENNHDFVVANKIIKNRLNLAQVVVALSPVSPLTPARLWNWMCSHQLTDCILNTQIHKHIWPDSDIER